MPAPPRRTCVARRRGDWSVLTTARVSHRGGGRTRSGEGAPSGPWSRGAALPEIALVRVRAVDALTVERRGEHDREGGSCVFPGEGRAQLAGTRAEPLAQAAVGEQRPGR